MLTKLSQWVSILFCSLPHGFLFKSHEITWSIKPRRCSLMYMSIRTLDYVIFSHQANLSKTTKHWDSFVSHCITNSLHCHPLQMGLVWVWTCLLILILWSSMTHDHHKKPGFLWWSCVISVISQCVTACHNGGGGSGDYVSVSQW